MEFTVADRESKLWQKLMQHYQDKLESFRIRNDAKMSEADRNFLLGQIQEVRTLLKLSEKAVVVPSTSILE